MWEFGHTTGWKTTWFSFSFEWEFHPLLTQFFSWPPCSSIPFPKVEENTLPAQRSLRDDDEKIPPTVKCTLQATAVVYYFCIFSIFFQYFLRLFFSPLFGITVVENHFKKSHFTALQSSESSWKKSAKYELY